MGAGGSMPTHNRSIEPPPLPPPFGNHDVLLSVNADRNSGASEDSHGRTASRASTITLGGPQSQGPSPYATLRREEWWHQRPSAPSLPNLPQQETLLTYATQMTGWQAAGGPSSSTSQNEMTELSRTVSHLAAANQQLATAHSMALAHLEALYVELKREKESKEETTNTTDQGNIELRKRLEAEDDDDRREMRSHIVRLESLLAEKSNFIQAHQTLQKDEEKQLRSQVERLENLLASKTEEICQRLSSQNVIEQEKNKDDDDEKRELIIRLRKLENVLASRSDGEADDEEKKQLKAHVQTLEILLAEKNYDETKASHITPVRKEETNRGPVEVEFLVQRQIQNVDYENALTRIKDLEGELQNEKLKNKKLSEEHIDTDLNRIYQSSVLRIQDLEREVQDLSEGRVQQNRDSNLETKYDMAVDRLVRLESESRQGHQAEKEYRENVEVQNKEIARLLEEIEKLQIDRFENKELNRKLRNDFEIQKKTIEQLEEDYKISRTQHEKLESELNESKEKFNKLSDDYDSEKRETVRLLNEIDAFQLEKDTANARILNLEQDLQKSLLEKEQMRNVESQKRAKLRAQLSEEVSDKKKQIRALEDALEEIQRLKVAVKADKKDTTKAEENIEIEDSNSEASTLERTLEATEESPEDLTNSRATNMEEFKKELTLKREARQRAIAAVSSEMDRLRRELGAEKEAHSETSRMLELLKSGENSPDRESGDTAARSEHEEEAMRLKKELKHEKESYQESLRRMEAQRITDTLRVSDELKSAIRYQTEKVDDLRFQLECEHEEYERQILTLKDVACVSREALGARERQINKLKDQLAQILARLGDRSYEGISDDVRAEYDHQLENIRNLRTLYDERLKVLIELKDNATKELADTKEKLEIFQKKCEGLEDDLKKSEDKVDTQDTEISNLESQLGLTKADCRDLENQMSVINSLFTQMLLSASSAEMDLDRLTRLLQENHDLISEMAREEGTEAAALPKLLLDLVEQVEGRNRALSSSSDAEKKEEDIQEGNIAHNLPKVWRVLLELLSCHAVEAPVVSASSSSAPDSCYKSVDTPTGPRLVISVSKTYIRLKELILEKKSLEKEMTRMKQLNTHLESKLGEQEKRLSTVSSELSKTWNIVGRMQAQHQQLHTHEKILRYELQQKRKMLQELKQELEYCREKWESARQKNTNTELEWRSLRREFAARKALAAQDSFNNSGESGFSDERGDESDEEDEAVEERVRISPRRRTRKESPRVPTPDTESEQPTDTELSDTKTGSSGTLEQRTPTPETEAEVDAEIIDCDSLADRRPATPEPDRTPDIEPMDPLDRALTNVIQSLIKIDHNSNPSTATTSREDISMTSTSHNFREPAPISRTKSVSPKRRNAKRDAREWSPRSEPWNSRITELDTGNASSKRYSKIENPTSVRNQRSVFPSTSKTATTEFELFNIISRSPENCPETIEHHPPNTITNSARSGSSLEPTENSTGEQRGGEKCNSSEEKLEAAEEPTDDKQVPKIEEPSRSTESPLPTVSVFSIGPYPSSKSPSPVKTVQFSEPLILGPSAALLPSAFNGDSLEGDEGSAATTTNVLDTCSSERVTEENVSSLKIWETDAKEIFTLVTIPEMKPSDIEESDEAIVENVIQPNDSTTGSNLGTNQEVENISIESTSSLDLVENFPMVPSTTIEASSILESADCTSSPEVHLESTNIDSLPVIEESPSASIPEVHLESTNIDSLPVIEESPTASIPQTPAIETVASETERISIQPASNINAITKSEEQNSTKPEISETPSTSASGSQSSASSSVSKRTRSSEEIFAARAARLKRLEEQADWLIKKMNATSQKGSALNSRLEELHEVYGEAPTPPPLPDVLPSVRLQNDLERERVQQIPEAPPNPEVLPARRISTEEDANESPPDNAP